ncbi:MAG: hypothetical protein NY202_01205 [Mollicutes bacterium UO1]
MEIKNLKYLALGILVGYLALYIQELTNQPTFRHSYNDEEEE